MKLRKMLSRWEQLQFCQFESVLWLYLHLSAVKEMKLVLSYSFNCAHRTTIQWLEIELGHPTKGRVQLKKKKRNGIFHNSADPPTHPPKMEKQKKIWPSKKAFQIIGNNFYFFTLTLYGSSMCDIAHPSLNLLVTFHRVKLEAWEN